MFCHNGNFAGDSWRGHGGAAHVVIGGGVIAETQIVDVDIAGDSGLAVRKHTQRSDADLEAAVIGIVGQCVNCRAPSSGQCNGLGEGVPFWRAVLV